MASSAEFKTILVVDDDPQFHALVVPVLTNRGHRLLSAHKGDEALRMLDAEVIDLAIVDGQLPDMTGIELITDLRSRGKQTLCMFVSAYWRDAQSYHKLTKELAVSLVLHKPVLASVFASEVDMLLGKVPGFSDPGQRDFEDTLLALRAEYARELPSRMEELAGLLEQMKTQPDNRFIFSEARTRAHKLRGTASSYGFKPIGELAARLEETIIILTNNPNDHQTLQTVQQLVHEAADLAARAAREADGKVQAGDAAKIPEFSIVDALDTGPQATILVVDDDAAFLDLVDELAKRHRLQTLRATNPSDALDLACMNQIDGALIDVELGSRDKAFKLAGDLRALPGYHELPLGFLSGVGHIEKMIEVENVGHCLVLDRPTQSDALEAAVRQLIAIKQASKPKVLLIDDDADFLKRTAFVLTHEGMLVHTLATTDDVLNEMQNFAPDLLVLDVMMPGVSGFDICRMLRTMPRWRDLPILFLTSYTDIDTRIACLRCGGDDYLLKPVVNEELLVRLQIRLERSRQLRTRLDYDNVSGLLQRGPFMNQFAGMLGEAKRQGWKVTLGLAAIVDTAADGSSQVVRSDSNVAAAGSLLNRKLTAANIKGRWSEAKIVLGFRNEPRDLVNQSLQNISEELASQGDQPVRFIYGTACYPDDGERVYELLEKADARLHDAMKQAVGRPGR